jgi:hypothetical protein
VTAVASWQELLARPLDGNHIAQLYHDQAFLTEALSHFIGSGLAHGEGVVVIARPEHWACCEQRLRVRDLGLQEAVGQGQLVVLDAGQTLSKFMVDGMPDWKGFQDVVGSVINQTRRRYAKVRAFGEMVDVLWRRGECRASMRLEELWNHLVKVQDLALCCAYRIDHLSDEAYNGPLESVCEMHSHVIPARDYERLEQTVHQACEEMLGPRLAGMMQALAGARRVPAHMPAAQSTLLWLKEHMPLTANKILSRLREYHERTGPEVA